MGRSCGGVDFGYNASDDVYQIYLIFEAFQIDIEDNPYLKDTKVQIRDSCSYPRKFPGDGKGNYEEYLKIPRGMAESDPYYKTYLIPYVEQGRINPSTGSYYTDDELFALYPWSAGEKEYGFFRCSTSKLYSWGQRIYNQLNNEETVNTVECDILYYLDEILNIRKALVNRDYKNCETGMFWRMQKRGRNPTYIDSNTLPPAFFIPNFNNIELYHKASYSEVYPFFKWFDYYKNFNPRRKGYTCSLLQYYTVNPLLHSYYYNINESVFNFFGSSVPNYESMGYFTRYTDLDLNYKYYDTNTLPPYVVYEYLSDVEYTMTIKEKYIYIRRKPICNDIGTIDYISNMTWPKTINVSTTIKIEDIIDPNQGFGVPVIPQDIKDRAAQISSILQNGITLKTNEEYYNARYYQSESKKYKYYKEYTTPNGINKTIDDDYDLYIIKEDDRSVFAYDTNIPYRIKDRGGFITANFSNDTNEWKYEKGFWKLQSGSKYIKDLRYHKYMQPILGFDGTAIVNYYLVVYNNKTNQYQSLTRLTSGEFISNEYPTPSSDEFNPSNFRNKLPTVVSYKGKPMNSLTAVSDTFSIDLKSPTNDSTYTIRFNITAKTLEFK